MRIKNFIWILMIVLLVHSATGLGVGPAYTNIDFEPNLEREYSFTIYNTDAKSFEATLQLEGELEQYIEIESKAVSFSEEDNEKTVFFYVSFPRDIPSGSYSGKLLVLESPTDSTDTITASVGVTHKIALEVPTHGKFIKETIEESEKEVTIAVENIGLKEINNLEIISIIKDDDNSFKDSKETTNFMPDDILTLKVSKPKSPGLYVHDIQIIYDELSKNITRTLRIGKIEISIVNLEIGKFGTGKILPIEIVLESNWNKELSIRTDIEIEKNGEIIETITGSDISIKDSATTRLFWDTESFEKGDYNLIAKVFHNNEIIFEEEFNVKLTEEGVKKKEISSLLIISLIIIILIIIYLLLKKKKRKL